MTVEELIGSLQKHNPDQQVSSRGYKDDYNDTLHFHDLRLIANPVQKDYWYYGEYESAYSKKGIGVSVISIELYGNNTKNED